MSDAVSQLEATLEQLVQLLRSHAENHWRRWLSRDLKLIHNRNLSGVDHLLSAYGGMGSLNDVFLCPENGNVIDAKDVAVVNEQLRNLISRAYNLARDIQRTN